MYMRRPILQHFCVSFTGVVNKICCMNGGHGDFHAYLDPRLRIENRNLRRKPLPKVIRQSSPTSTPHQTLFIHPSWTQVVYSDRSAM